MKYWNITPTMVNISWTTNSSYTDVSIKYTIKK